MPGRAPDRGVRDLTGMLNRAGHVLANRLAEALAEVDLTPRMQCVLVHAIDRDRTQVELAELADLDKTTMVATADALETAGLARRVPSPLDRRARIIAVTDEGRRAARTGQRIVDRVHREVLDTLPDEDAEVLLRALSQLVEDESVMAPATGPVRRRRSAA